MDVDIIPGMTPLALAAKSRDPESIIELVKLNLDRWAKVLSTCQPLDRFFKKASKETKVSNCICLFKSCKMYSHSRHTKFLSGGRPKHVLSFGVKCVLLMHFHAFGWWFAIANSWF